MEILTISPKETQKTGIIFAKEILKLPLRKRALVLGLKGDLGGGKTTFLQGLARGLRIREKILSPTFILMRKFQIPNSKFQTFYHIDCYRIEKPKEILDLGFKEIILNPKNIIAIEWSERVKKILPKETITLKFNFINKSTRKIEIK